MPNDKKNRGGSSHGANSQPQPSKPAPDGGANGDEPVGTTVAPTATALMLDEQSKRHKIWLGAMVASSSSAMVTYPFDSLKTRQQTYNYKSLLHCIRATYKVEGARGFWRGVAGPLISYTGVRTFSMTLYMSTKERAAILMKTRLGFDAKANMDSTSVYPSLAAISCIVAAGATTGFAMGIVACPFEISKLGAQLSMLMADRKQYADPAVFERVSRYANKGSVGVMREIIRQRGFAGLYTGIQYQLLKDTLGTSLYFVTYESMKQSMSAASLGSHWSQYAFLAGGLAGVMALVPCYAIDTVKCRYQQASLAFERGRLPPVQPVHFFRGTMYKGLPASMGRSALNSALFFFTYEFIVRKIESGG